MTAAPRPAPHPETPARVTAWPARRIFDELKALGPLRVISVSGPSVFEAICELDAFGVANGWFNAVTSAYHWHLRLDGLRHVTSRETIHGRSGRRVLFLELREAAEADPFLLIYLHRERAEEFAGARENRFAAVHRRFEGGAWLAPEGGTTRGDREDRR